MEKPPSMYNYKHLEIPILITVFKVLEIGKSDACMKFAIIL